MIERKYYESGKVYRLQIESTQRCPQLCKYCYVGSKIDSTHGLSSSEITGLLKEAANLGVQVIGWFGGDPLVRSDWYELCVCARDLGMTNEIWSSGIPLADQDVAKRAVEVTEGGVISTHLDSLNPKKYAQLSDLESPDEEQSSIQDILRGVENCIAAGKRPDEMSNCITITAPSDEDDVEQTMRHFQEKYGISTCLTLFNPVGENKDIKLWEPSLKKVKNIFKRKFRINGSFGSAGNGMDLSKFFCGTVVCVAYDGWLLPCSVIRTKEFGNIKDYPFVKLLEKGRNRLLYLDFRNHNNLPVKCRSCSAQDECFGCRSNAFYYLGDLLGQDPKCFGYKKRTPSCRNS